jgi:hypothetical protein
MNDSPSFEVYLHKNVLKAIGLFQSTDASRYVLNSVCIEVQAVSEDCAHVTYVATDGRVLGCYHDQLAEFSGPVGLARRFAFDFGKYLKHFKGGRILVRVYPGDKGDRLELLDEHQKVCVRDTAVDGNFPAWRACFPTKVEQPGITKSVNPVFLRKFTDAAKVLAGKADASLHLVGFAGDEADRSAYLVYCQDGGFAGVLMPLGKIERHYTHGVPGFCRPENAPRVPVEPPEHKLESGEKSDDELLREAFATVKELKRVSTSTIQRRLRLGYNRAAGIVERMEKLGICGPEEGSAPRKILVDLDTYQLPAA